MPAFPRPVRVALAGLFIGAIAGVFGAFATTPSYRARSTIVVAPGLRTAGASLETTTRTVAALVGSATVLDNVTGALGEPRGALAGAVRARPRHGTALVEITVDEPSAGQAERVAQQILVVLPAIAAARLPTRGGPAVSVVDSPSGSARSLGRPVTRNLVLGGAAGSLLALVVLAALRSRTRRASKVPAPRPARVAAQPRVVPEAPEAPPHRPAASPPPAPPPAAPPAAVVHVPGPAPPAHGRARLSDLERIAALETDPLRRDELELYLEQLRGHVTADGTLPPNFEPLVEQVFGDLQV